MIAASDRMEIKRIEFFADLVDVVERELLEMDLPAPAARAVANALADFLAKDWGGQNFNIPKDYHRKIAERDLAIYEEFNGWDYGTLARKYGLSERGLRKLISRARAMVISRVQVDMFQSADQP
ncbi:MAG: Mor transcription activator family protein [Burkholderiaceae bacterium]